MASDVMAVRLHLRRIRVLEVVEDTAARLVVSVKSTMRRLRCPQCRQACGAPTKPRQNADSQHKTPGQRPSAVTKTPPTRKIPVRASGTAHGACLRWQRQGSTTVHRGGSLSEPTLLGGGARALGALGWLVAGHRRLTARMPRAQEPGMSQGSGTVSGVRKQRLGILRSRQSSTSRIPDREVRDV